MILKNKEIQMKNQIDQIDAMMDATKYIEKYNKVPTYNSLTTRIGKHVCCALLCIPCYIWSALLRIAACPFQYACNGIGFICSNNHCTNLSDKCISNYINEIDGQICFKHLDKNKLSIQEIQKLWILIEYLKNIFKVTSYNKMHYTLCDVIIIPLTSTPYIIPHMAIQALNALQTI